MVRPGDKKEPEQLQQELEQILEIDEGDMGAKAYNLMDLRQLYDISGKLWSILEIDGKIEGYAIFTYGMDGQAWLLALSVSKPYREHGYGRALIEAGLARLDRSRVDVVLATVAPANSAAQRLHRKIGFVEVHHENRYFGKGEPRDVLAYKMSD